MKTKIKRKYERLTEVVRSFSLKVNLGNYSMMDCFCSQKEEVPIEEAKEASERLYLFCKAEVESSVEKYLEERTKKVDDSTGLPIIQQEEKPQPRTKYGKDNCGCRFGRTCDSHKIEYMLDAEQYNKENLRVPDVVPEEFK